MEDIYNRQQNIQLNIPTSITIVGCGGIGSWIAYLGAIIGIKKITLVDGDKIEEHNLNRTPFFYYQIGEYKTEALKTLINSLRPNTQVITINQHLSRENINQIKEKVGNDTIITCVDNNNARELINKYFSNNKKYYCYAEGNDTWKIEEELKETFEFNTGYRIIPQWLYPNLMCSIQLLYKILK
jgi:sulfur carrier protein ThiS adenylyltransferase